MLDADYQIILVDIYENFDQRQIRIEDFNRHCNPQFKFAAYD